MNPWLIIPMIIAYVMVGIFVGTLTSNGMDDTWLPWAIVFWPLVLVFIIITGLLSLPMKLAEWILERMGKQ